MTNNIEERAVVTVIGKDSKGIISKVSSILFENQVNILDISQNVMQDVFAMVMLVDISRCKINFSDLVSVMDECGQKTGMKIHTMHEKIFDTMHRI